MMYRFTKMMLGLTAVFVVYCVVQEHRISSLSADVRWLERSLLMRNFEAAAGSETKLRQNSHYRNVLAMEENSSSLGWSHETAAHIYPRDVEEKLVNIYRERLSKMEMLDIPKAVATISCADETRIDRACVDSTCSANFIQPPEGNLRDLLHRQYRIPGNFMHVINNMADRKFDKTRISFVTASSANHFYEAQVLIKSLVTRVFPHLDDFRLYVYDLGLKPGQIETLKKHCRQCRVRKFPFGQLPATFSNLKSYTWKPIIVQVCASRVEHPDSYQHLDEYSSNRPVHAFTKIPHPPRDNGVTLYIFSERHLAGNAGNVAYSYAHRQIEDAHLSVSEFVFWMDSSVRFLTGNLARLLETVRQRGILLSSTHYSAPLHTDRKMYRYFNVKPCQMSPFRELEGTFLVFHNDFFTQHAIVTSWVSCAFAPDCMYPFKEIPAESRHYDCRLSTRKYSTCHRFDQSALGTILSKIYMANVGYVILPKNRIHVNKRGEKIKYFPE